MDSLRKAELGKTYYCYGKDICIKFCDASKKLLIQYKQNEPLCVRLNNKSAIMLRLLLQNEGRVVSHCAIAKEAACNSYREGIENEEAKSGVRDIRNLLVNSLKKAGIPIHVIKKIIVPVENIGYKLNGT